MGLFDLFHKDEESIKADHSSDFVAMNMVSYARIKEESKKAIKKISAVKEDWTSETLEALQTQLDKYEKIHSHQPLTKSEDYLDPEEYILVQDLTAKVFERFNQQKRYKEEYYVKEFVNQFTLLVIEMNSDMIPEFRNDEYFEAYAMLVFIRCETEQLSHDEKESRELLEKMQEEYEKNPREAFLEQINEMKVSHGEAYAKLSDYISMDRAINWQLTDIKREIRKSLRKPNPYSGYGNR